MKSYNRFFASIFAITIALTWTCRAHAGIPVFYSWGEEQIIKVADFPQTPEFVNIEGKHFDAGYRYKQISIFLIPLWNYDEKWCAYVDSKHYVDVTKSDLAERARGGNIALPATFSIPFWDSYGGKLILAALVLLYLGYSSRGQENPAP